MNPLTLLFSRGAEGVPPPERIDFAGLRLPASPNVWLGGPAGTHPDQHATIPPFAAAPDAVLAAIGAVAAEMPRTFRLGAFPGQLHWVVRSATMNYPDIVVAEVRPLGAGTGLILFARSLIGWSDLGVNRARAEAWLAALRARLG
jgi:uncharacterized protein (DUF1499 family)